MQAKCPRCGQALRIPDELPTKRVQCPKCQTVLLVPAPRKPAAPSPAPRPAPPPAGPDLKLADEPTPGPAARAGITPGKKPVCYLAKDNDQIRAITRLFSRLRDVLPEEGLDYEFADIDSRYSGPPELRPDDVHVTAGVTQADYGSRFIRYVLTPLSLLGGVGACKLRIEGELREAGDRVEPFLLKTYQGIGLFGGSDEGLMEANVKVLERRFARAIGKALTGKRVLNTDAYRCAKAALICGLIGLIPFIGFLMCLPALVLGGIALGTITSRRLPKRKGMAIAGTVLGVLDLAISVAVAMQGG